MEGFIPTRVSAMKEDAKTSFVSVDYKAHKRKQKEDGVSSQMRNKRKVNDEESTPAANTRDVKKQQELEMKRTRYEVMRFGMAGFKKAHAHKAKTSLLVSLGAKPPKNRCLNYKDLKKERMRQKEKESREERVSGLAKSMTRHKTAMTKRKKDANDILDVYGKVETRKMSNRRR